MNKAKLLRRLCTLTTMVMDLKFHFEVPADCFCDRGDSHTATSEEVVAFIEAAVHEKLDRESK